MNKLNDIKAIGGYFSLEVNEGYEYHNDAIRLNAGKFALEYILRARKYKKVYIPFYICESVLQPFKHLGVAYDFYHINENLEPVVNLSPDTDEAVLYVNYFGLKNNFTNSFCYAYKNTILDLTQAFYCAPGNKYENKECNCDTYYSCRKFFGVADGAYLYTSCRLNEDIPQDESFERMTFLMKRIDRSPQEAYADFQTNDDYLDHCDMRRMSRLTQLMMKGIHYTAKANRRLCNFYFLDKVLRDTNRFKWAINSDTVPMVYPYYIENGAKLRQHLINHQVFCARYWPNVMEWCKLGELEYDFAENIVCIPIDQRYDENNMQIIINIIESYKNKSCMNL